MPGPPRSRGPVRWRDSVEESASLAVDSLRTHRARSLLAITGIVIGIVTVVLVASVLANVRNQIAILFRDLGTDNIFAFHITGDPYSAVSEKEARRLPLRLEWVSDLKRLTTASKDVGAQVIVPATSADGALVARAGENESDTVLVEGVTPTFFDIIGAEFERGRPFTVLEDRAAAKVAVIGASLSSALYGSQNPIGRTLTLGGDTYTVVGELQKRRGGFLGENRQDSVLSLPVGTVRKRFGTPDKVVLYVQAKPGERDVCYRQTEAVMRQLRQLPPTADNDFTLSTADGIIST
ncbi:MAG: ABC transporter permease, partial [Acidobacteriota bacterium]